MSDIQNLINAINEFRDERNWRQYHNPKDLAISISIEAAELLEDFNGSAVKKHSKPIKKTSVKKSQMF